MPDIKAHNKLKAVKVSKESMRKKLSKFSRGWGHLTEYIKTACTQNKGIKSL